MKAIVNAAVCCMYNQPTHACTVEDEVLYGMIVDILEEAVPLRISPVALASSITTSGTRIRPNAIM